MSLKRQFRGYNRKQVDELLEKNQQQIEMQDKLIEKMKNEIEELKSQNEKLTHKVDIQEKTNEEIARLALKEASNLIEKAKRNANMILKESMEYVRSLHEDIDEFKKEAIDFRKNVVKMQEDMLETIDKSEIFSLIEEENKNA
jgi:cell division septum initiation protein DivIVA